MPKAFWLARRLQLVLAGDDVVTVHTSGWATVLLPLWAQRHLPTGGSSCYVGYEKLITAILFPKLVHHRAPQKMSISVMLFSFKNTTPQAKHGTLYSRHIGSRTVGRSEVTEQNSKKIKNCYKFHSTLLKRAKCMNLPLLQANNATWVILVGAG